MARKTTTTANKPATPDNPKSGPKPKQPGTAPATGGNDAARTAALAKLQVTAPSAPPAAVGRNNIAKAKDAKPTPKTASKPNVAKGKKEEPRTGGLTAAHQVLSTSKEPMNVRDITKAAMGKGLWSPEGKTPWSTLAAAIGREIKDKGKQSRFKKTNRGLFVAVTPR